MGGQSLNTIAAGGRQSSGLVNSAVKHKPIMPKHDILGQPCVMICYFDE